MRAERVLVVSLAVVWAGCVERAGVDAGGVDQGVDLIMADISAPDLAPAPDLGVPLGILSVSPVRNARWVRCDTAVNVVFSEPIASKTVTSSSFAVTTPKGAVSGKLTAAGRAVTFQASTRLQPLVPHTVMVTTGITTPDGRSLPGAESWTFTCDRTWGNTETLTSAGYAYPEGGGPWVQIDGNDDGHAVWIESKDKQLWGRRYRASTAKWEAAVNLSGGTKAMVGGYNLVSDGAGDIWLVWWAGDSSTTPTKVTLNARRYDAATRAWQAVRTTTMAGGSPPQWMSADAFPGGVAVTWDTPIPSFVRSIYLQYYSRQKAAWSAAQLVVDKKDNKVAHHPSVRVNGTGTTVLLGWRYYPGPTSVSFLVSRGSFLSKTWSTAVQVAPSYPEYRIRDAFNADWRGSAMVLYPVVGLHAVRYDTTTGKWLTPRYVNKPETYQDYAGFGSHRSSGRVLAAFGQSTSRYGDRYLWANRFDPVKKVWLGPHQVNSKPIDYVYSTAVDAQGNGLVLFRYRVGGIWTVRLDGRSGIWGTPRSLNSQAAPANVVFGSRGQALAVWALGSFDAINARWFE